MRRRGYSRLSSSACTFFASGLGHTLPIFCGLKDLRMMGSMLGYFIIQFFLLMLQNVFVENKEILGGMKKILSWGITMALVLVPAPLFVLPALCLAKWCPPNPVEVFYQREFWALYLIKVCYLVGFVRLLQLISLMRDNHLLQHKLIPLKKD